jgi:hypothetical protein
VSGQFRRMRAFAIRVGDVFLLQAGTSSVTLELKLAKYELEA